MPRSTKSAGFRVALAIASLPGMTIELFCDPVSHTLVGCDPHNLKPKPNTQLPNTQHPKPKPLTSPAYLFVQSTPCFAEGAWAPVFDDSRTEGEIQHLLPTLLIHVAPGGHRGSDHRVSQVENVVFKF